MQKEKHDIIIAIVVSSLFLSLIGCITFLVVVHHIRTKRRLLSEKEIRDAQYQQAVLRAQLEMQDHTFKVISQDIHDNVGQILGLIKLNLNILTLHQKDNEILNNLKELVTSASADLRDLGAGYYADHLIEKGLINAIRHQIQQLEKTGLFTTSFYAEPYEPVMDKNKIIFIYRMVQEVLNNILKHSAANHVAINIYQAEDRMYIKIADNGKGFETSDSGFTPGIGLSSIQQRASMIDATVDIQSEPGTGTTIIFTFKENSYDKISFGG